MPVSIRAVFFLAMVTSDYLIYLQGFANFDLNSRSYGAIKEEKVDSLIGPFVSQCIGRIIFCYRAVSVKRSVETQYGIHSIF